VPLDGPVIIDLPQAINTAGTSAAREVWSPLQQGRSPLTS
jgi:hypothetical protein